MGKEQMMAKYFNYQKQVGRLGMYDMLWLIMIVQAVQATIDWMR